MGIRYGNTIIKKDPCFFVSLCHCVILGLGQAVRVSVEQSVPVMAVRPVFISLSLDNVISPSYGGQLVITVSPCMDTWRRMEMGTSVGSVSARMRPFPL